MKAKLRILHLEDDSQDADLVMTALTMAQLNPEITLAKSAREFLEAVHGQKFDVILSDTRIPGYHGNEARQKAREIQPKVPFIFVSGFVDPEDAEQRQRESGADACISKSDLDQLANAIVQCLRARENPGARPESPAPSIRASSFAPSSRVDALARLVVAVQELAMARDLESIMAIVRRAARELTGADGATFVLRDGEFCHYVDEDAIGPLWKGKRFPLDACISGWVMVNRRSAIVRDIYSDPRIPLDAYRPTFVKSLVMVPIRTLDPVGAIGNYWATEREPQLEEVRLLQALADSTSVAMESVRLYAGLERTVADRTACLQALNAELEAFAFSVSHDLRGPLRHIAGYVGLVREEAGETLDEKSQRRLAVVADAARRMGLLIDDLLSFSRLGRAELSHQSVPMGTLVREAIEELRPEFEPRAIEWVVGPLPEVRGDRAMLKQVWLNLVSNAVKYTRGRNPARIEIAGSSNEQGLEFLVRDNGVGFEMEAADQLFGAFQRLHSDDEFEGTGLGLANVRRIISRHGGRTWANGEVGTGATFYFSLPKTARFD